MKQYINLYKYRPKSCKNLKFDLTRMDFKPIQLRQCGNQWELLGNQGQRALILQSGLRQRERE